jgi:hypothetical protein
VALPQPPAHLLDAHEESRMPPLVGVMLAAATSAALWAAILTAFFQ